MLGRRRSLLTLVQNFSDIMTGSPFTYACVLIHCVVLLATSSSSSTDDIRFPPCLFLLNSPEFQ